MSEEKQPTLEHRVAALEKYVQKDLWVTNTSFWKRNLSIYGHTLLASIVFSAVITLMVLLAAVVFAVIAALAQ